MIGQLKNCCKTAGRLLLKHQMLLLFSFIENNSQDAANKTSNSQQAAK
jgi:hypothetical protein